MTGSQQNATSSFALSDDMTGCWCAQDTILTDQKLLDSVRSSNLGYQLDNLGVPVSAITADDQEASLDAFRNRKENAGDE